MVLGFQGARNISIYSVFCSESLPKSKHRLFDNFSALTMSRKDVLSDVSSDGQKMHNKINKSNNSSSNNNNNRNKRNHRNQRNHRNHSQTCWGIAGMWSPARKKTILTIFERQLLCNFTMSFSYFVVTVGLFFQMLDTHVAGRCHRKKCQRITGRLVERVTHW